MDDSKREEARTVVDAVAGMTVAEIEASPMVAVHQEAQKWGYELSSTEAAHIAEAALDAAALTPPADPTDDDREALVAILVNNRQAIAGSMHQYVDSETTADLVLASGFRRPTPTTRESAKLPQNSDPIYDEREALIGIVMPILRDADGLNRSQRIGTDIVDGIEQAGFRRPLMSRFTITPKDDTA